MVKKLIITILIIFLLTSCATPVKKIDIVESKIPVLYVIKPPDVDKPDLQILNLTDTERKDIGEVSKAYAIDIIQLTNYIEILELIINKYKELSKNNSLENLSEIDLKTIKDTEEYFNSLKGKK